MTVFRVHFAPHREIAIDVDAASPSAAISEARSVWCRNASDPRFVVTEPAHDAAFAQAHAQAITHRFLVQVTEIRIHQSWVQATSDDDAIDVAERLYDNDDTPFDLIDHEVKSVRIMKSEALP